jgi:putative thioredoxin
MEVKSQIIDVDQSNFEQIVLQGSAEQLVVVDFWAPWCEPCKTLGPILEEVVMALGPSVVLAKVNVDDNQELATAFRVQGIPAVKIVRNGKLVDEFTGALPKAEIEATLRRHVPDAPPSEEEVAGDLLEQGQAVLESGDLIGAASVYEQVLHGDADNGGALTGLARVRLMEGEFAEVEELVGKIEQGTGDYDRGQAVLKQIELHRVCEAAGGPAQCAERCASDADDLQARYQLACCTAVSGDYETALREWFAIIERNKDFLDGGVREAMVSVFQLLGRHHPVVGDYPQRLYRLMY